MRRTRYLIMVDKVGPSADSICCGEVIAETEYKALLAARKEMDKQPPDRVRVVVAP